MGCILCVSFPRGNSFTNCNIGANETNRIWGLAEGSRRISVDAEVIAYSVLDILTKGVFGFWLLFAYKQIAASNVEIGGYWANGASTEGRIRIGDDEAA
jgi:bacteriorhodopsin